MEKAEDQVNIVVDVPLTQDQFDALVSLTYNIGRYSFMGSTLARLLNQGDYLGAADQFHRWVKSGGERVSGLVGRRQAEKRLFLSEGF